MHQLPGTLRTTSTEQPAPAATLDETLPMRKRSIPLNPRAPRKMQSAFQLEAASTRISRGSPSGVVIETANPALCNFPSRL